MLRQTASCGRCGFGHQRLEVDAVNKDVAPIRCRRHRSDRQNDVDEGTVNDAECDIYHFTPSSSSREIRRSSTCMCYCEVKLRRNVEVSHPFENGRRRTT